MRGNGEKRIKHGEQSLCQRVDYLMISLSSVEELVVLHFAFIIKVNSVLEISASNSSRQNQRIEMKIDRRM